MAELDEELAIWVALNQSWVDKGVSSSSSHSSVARRNFSFVHANVNSSQSALVPVAQRVS